MTNLQIAQSLIDSPLLLHSQERFEDKYYSICLVVFGLTPEAVNEENLILGIFKAICERFIGITINDIEQAFSIHEPKEKVYVLSRKDFIEPIAEYWRKKMILQSEINSIIKDKEMEVKSEEYKRIFKKESIELYLKCVKSDGVWTGTAFQATTFAKDCFAHLFSQPEKDSFYTLAKSEVVELNAKRNLSLMDGLSFDIPVVNEIQMFCQIVTTEACKRGFEVIID